MMSRARFSRSKKAKKAKKKEDDGSEEETPITTGVYSRMKNGTELDIPESLSDEELKQWKLMYGIPVEYSDTPDVRTTFQTGTAGTPTDETAKTAEEPEPAPATTVQKQDEDSAKKTRRIQSLERENDRLRSELEKTVKDSDEKEKEAKKAKAELAKARLDLGAQEERAGKYKEDSDRYKKESEEQRKQADLYRGLYEKLKSSTESAMNQSAEADRKQIEAASGRIKELEEIEETLRDEISSKDREIASLKEYETKCISLDQSLSNAMSEIERLKGSPGTPSGTYSSGTLYRISDTELRSDMFTDGRYCVKLARNGSYILFTPDVEGGAVCRDKTMKLPKLKTLIPNTRRSYIMTNVGNYVLRANLV